MGEFHGRVFYQAPLASAVLIIVVKIFGIIFMAHHTEKDGTFFSDDAAALKEIYDHVHKEMMDIRGLVFQLNLIYAGTCGVVTGWIANKQDAIKLPLCVSIFVIFTLACVFMLYFLESLKKQFNEKALVINRIQAIWGAFDVGRFGLKDKMLFPETWKDFGDKRWGENLFVVCYFTIIGGTLLVWSACTILQMLTRLGSHN